VAVLVGGGHGDLLDLGGVEAGGLPGDEEPAEAQQGEVGGPGRRHHPGAEARVQFGGEPAVGGSDTIHREHPAKPGAVAEMGPDSARRSTHLLADVVGRVPGGGYRGVAKAIRSRHPEDHHLDGPKGSDGVGEHHAVDAARHPIQKWHHPHPVTVTGHEL
jgi:hypothetical protein